MISREIYMKRIRPFINTELIKVFTGIRRSGKSVMLELVKNELKKSGVSDKNFLCINFEQFSNSELLDAKILHKRIEDLRLLRADLRRELLGEVLPHVHLVEPGMVVFSYNYYI